MAPRNDSLSHFALGPFSPWLWALVSLSTCFSQPLGKFTVGKQMRGSVWMWMKRKVPQGKDISEVALPLTRTWRAGLWNIIYPIHYLLTRPAIHEVDSFSGFWCLSVEINGLRGKSITECSIAGRQLFQFRLDYAQTQVFRFQGAHLALRVAT